MAKHETPESKARLPQAIECVLRAVLLSEGTKIPTNPKEVALYKAWIRENRLEPVFPQQTPSLLFSWERADVSPKTANIVPFVHCTIAEGLALAARSGESVSVETRSKLSEMVVEMRNDKNQLNAHRS